MLKINKKIVYGCLILVIAFMAISAIIIVGYNMYEKDSTTSAMNNIHQEESNGWFSNTIPDNISDDCKNRILWVKSEANKTGKYRGCTVKSMDDAYKYMVCKEPLYCTEDKNINCSELVCEAEPVKEIIPDKFPVDLDPTCRSHAQYVLDNKDKPPYNLCKIENEYDAYKYMVCKEPMYCMNDGSIDCSNLICESKPIPEIKPSLVDKLPSDLDPTCRSHSQFVWNNRNNPPYNLCKIDNEYDAYRYLSCNESNICKPFAGNDCNGLKCANKQLTMIANTANTDGRIWKISNGGDKYANTNFLNGFNFYAGDDQTHGHIRYVDQPEALARGLILYNDTIKNGIPVKQLKINVATTPENNGKRASVKLRSNKRYNGGLFVMDLDHMPEGKAVWPAFWLTGSNWPCDGEIDIMESVNSYNDNTSINHCTLHTQQKCVQDGVPNISNNGMCGNGRGSASCTPCGNGITKDCAYVGCGVKLGQGTAGHLFNKNGGGVYACEWKYNGTIKIWVFPRNDVEKYVPFNATEINTAKWPKPSVEFKPCPDSFKENRITINTTLCGDWAGPDFSRQGWGNCSSYVSDVNNKFNDAYWLINYVKVFQ